MKRIGLRLSLRFVKFRMQHSDERQIAVTLGEIKSVADHEEIGNCKSGVIGVGVGFATRLFVEKNARADGGGFELLQPVSHGGQSPAGVEDVIDDENLAAFNIEAEFFSEKKFARSCSPGDSWRRP